MENETEQTQETENTQGTPVTTEAIKARLEEENLYLRQEVHGDSSRLPDFVGESKALRQVLRQIEQVAMSEATCLIEGETGRSALTSLAVGKNLPGRA